MLSTWAHHCALVHSFPHMGTETQGRQITEMLEVVRALAGARSDGGAPEQTEAGVRELVDAAVVAAICGTRDAGRAWHVQAPQAYLGEGRLG